MTMPDKQKPPAGVSQRGPVEHERRQQIIQAAGRYFREYGYKKTTVSDLAKDIGVTAAYVYNFFDSKQAIGEAICASVAGRIETALQEIVGSKNSPSDQLRMIYKCLVQRGYELYLGERKLHDIVVAAIEANWNSIIAHQAFELEIIRRVVAAGRETGEFERKTPLDDVCVAISKTLVPFSNPMLLAREERSQLEEEARAVASLVLRSLAP